MTKPRNPVSFERALAKIAGLLGWPECANIVSQSERTVRNWSDPDTSSAIRLDAALALDIAYRAAGGDGAPMFQCYALRLEMESAARAADGERLAALTALAMKEGGEAFSALALALRPGATAIDRAVARRETEEAIEALTHTLHDLGNDPAPCAPAERHHFTTGEEP